MSKLPEVIVNDHAVLRYLERVMGFPIEQVRETIRADCEAAVRAGARSLKKGGVQYHFDGYAVKTVTDTQPLPSRTARTLCADPNRRQVRR